jgi:hypothetical protein
MVIFESDEYALPGWDMLSSHKDRLWTLKQCKKYITRSILRDCGIVMTWTQSGVGWLVGNFVWQHAPFQSLLYSIQRWFGLLGGAKTFPRVLIATSQWYMQRWCSESGWIGPRWWHIAVLTSLRKQLTFPQMLIGTGGLCTTP